MTEPDNPQRTYHEVIDEILSEQDGPLAYDQLLSELLQRRPSTYKTARHSANVNIKHEEGYLWVPFSADEVLPIRVALNGARFRLRRESAYMKHADFATGKIALEFLGKYISRRHRDHITLLDINDQPIPFKYQESAKGIFLLSGRNLLLGDWLQAQGFSPEDHLLFTVLDWDTARFRLEIEKAAEVDWERLQQRNQQLTKIFYRILQSQPMGDMLLTVALPLAYLQLEDRAVYPPDHCWQILNADRRIRYYGNGIEDLRKRLDPENPLYEEIFGSLPEPSDEDLVQVYTWRAELKERSGEWREIETQGSTTLWDFDHILRQAFDYSTGSYSHLSSFSKLVEIPPTPGRSRTSFEEVSIARINPGQEDWDSSKQVWELEMHPGDRLMYDYNLRRSTHHYIILQSISELEAGVEYPRQTRSSQD